MKVTAKSVTSNLIWRFLERCGAQIVTLIVSIVLARILDPDDYGVIALVTVFITILQVFVDSGFANALIQKKDADDTDFSSVFFFNIVLCLVLYIAMFFCAIPIANFYGIPELVPIVRVLSLTIIISGVKNVQQAYVSKNFLFKKFFFSTISGAIISGAIGIYMACAGYGIWALVGQTLANNLIGTVVLWITVKWRPKKSLSFERLKGLFSYGWKLLVSALIDTGYNQLRQLLIGKLYSSEDLAYYNQGEKLPGIIVTNINTSIDSVLFPAMSEEQGDVERVKAITRRAIKTATYIMMPIMMGLAVCAEPLVSLILTDKWLPCVFYLRIFCFTYAFYPIHTANLNAIKALGRSDLFLKLELIKKGVGVVALLATMFISVEAMAWSLLFTSIASQIINSWPNKKLLKYGYVEQLKDMLPQIILSVVMGAIVFSITFIGLQNWLTLIIQIILGIVVYILGSKLFKVESFQYTVNIIKSFKNKK